MKKIYRLVKTIDTGKKGYNEKNPGQPEGAFTPDAHSQQKKSATKSNAADKKQKEDQN